MSQSKLVKWFWEIFWLKNVDIFICDEEDELFC